LPLNFQVLSLGADVLPEVGLFFLLVWRLGLLKMNAAAKADHKFNSIF
jgi:hypothetical protein